MSCSRKGGGFEPELMGWLGLTPMCFNDSAEFLVTQVSEMAAVGWSLVLATARTRSCESSSVDPVVGDSGWWWEVAGLTGVAVVLIRQGCGALWRWV